MLGVAIGGDRGSSYLASKEVLYKTMEESSPHPELDDLDLLEAEVGPQQAGFLLEGVDALLDGEEPRAVFEQVAFGEEGGRYPF